MGSLTEDLYKRIKSESFRPLFFRKREGFIGSTTFAEPLFREFLLIDAVYMEPLPFAVCIFTHDHLSKRGPTAVAVFRLIGIILPLTAL
jgi:hypothetical protein